MPKLILVRHGHVAGIQPERFRGREDVPLSAAGERQAAASASSIASRWQPTTLYSSPLMRCIQTSQEIARACDIEVAVLEDLVDLDYGAWQRRLHTEVRGEFSEAYARCCCRCSMSRCRCTGASSRVRAPSTKSIGSNRRLGA